MQFVRMTIGLTAGTLASAGFMLGMATLAQAQPAPAAPPAVGVIEATNRPITESSEFLGRIEATNRVNVVARVTAFLEKRSFDEGAEVKTGDLLYRLERGPFEADLDAKKAQVAQLQATLVNAKLTTDRAKTLLGGPAGQQSTYDAAVANQQSLEAQIQAAQAQVQLSQINLDYTEIQSPIDGKIGRTAVTEGNVVTPSSGSADHHRQPGPDVCRRFRSRCARRCNCANATRPAAASRRWSSRCGCPMGACMTRPASSTSSTTLSRRTPTPSRCAEPFPIRPCTIPRPPAARSANSPTANSSPSCSRA